MRFSLTRSAVSCFFIHSMLFGSTDNAETHDFTSPPKSDFIAPDLISKGKDSVIVATKRIYIDGYPEAFNPSIIRTDDGILMLFRSLPDPHHRPFISDTGALWLNDSLEPISAPQLLIIRNPGDPTPQQAEDIRVFSLNGELYLVYNDNVDVVNASEWDHRDMFIAKLNYKNKKFSVEAPQKIIHPDYYEKVKWQKNWQPFEWHGNLLIGYTINPHEILAPDLKRGFCTTVYKTEADIKWHWGKLRGGALAQREGDEYLAFFHSPIQYISETTQGRYLMHYFMGAYTFSGEPPFQLTRISPYPLVSEGFYTPSPLGIRCIYPGGYVTAGPYIYLAYGKDDKEVWIAIIDKEKLFDSLVPVKEKEQDVEELL